MRIMKLTVVNRRGLAASFLNWLNLSAFTHPTPQALLLVHLAAVAGIPPVSMHVGKRGDFE